MIETGWVTETRGARSSRGRARRAHEVLDEYDDGGMLSEALEDELCSELTGLWPRSRQGRGRALPPPAPTQPVRSPRPTRRGPEGARTAARPGRAHLALVRSVD